MFPVALRMVWDVYEAVKIPVIGCGGVSSAEDVCEMMLAGATAVEVGAANLKDPFACKRIIEALPALCRQLERTGCPPSPEAPIRKSPDFLSSPAARGAEPCGAT